MHVCTFCLGQSVFGMNPVHLGPGQEQQNQIQNHHGESEQPVKEEGDRDEEGEDEERQSYRSSADEDPETSRDQFPSSAQTPDSPQQEGQQDGQHPRYPGVYRKQNCVP